MFFIQQFLYKIIEIVELRVSRQFQEFNESAIFFFFFFLHGNGIGETFENKKDGIVKNYQGKLCNRFENSADSCSKKILFERRGTIFSSRSRFHDSCFLSLFSFFFF